MEQIPFDLLFVGGTILTDGLEIVGDLAIRQGKIAAIGKLEGLPASEVIDASGKYVMPGLIDLGLNLLENGIFDPESGAGLSAATKDAALGGITTVISVAEVLPDEDVAVALSAQLEADAARAHVDFGYHLLATEWSATTAKRLRAAVDVGVASVYFGRQHAGANQASPEAALRALQEVGADVLVVIPNFHDLAFRLRESGAQQWADLHRGEDEALLLQAVGTALKGRASKALVLDLATTNGVEALAEIRAQGLAVYGAGASLSLILTGHPELIFSTWPPEKSVIDRDTIYRAVEDGLLTTLTAQHKPRTRIESTMNPKEGRVSVGAAVYSHWLTLLLREETELSPAALSLALAADPAKLAGLYPRKGTLLPGADGDVVLVTAKTEAPVISLAAKESSPFSFSDPLAGLERTSRIDAVYLRGKQISADGEPLGTPSGCFLERKLKLR